MQSNAQKNAFSFRKLLAAVTCDTIRSSYILAVLFQDGKHEEIEYLILCNY